jgi:PAS domain S-box-containing protein
MSASALSPQRILQSALDALGDGDDPAALDALPAAIYLTDAEGVITYFNPACVDFAGRTPEPGIDRWCVTWKLFTEAGRFMPHDQCPMAVTIREKRPVRGLSALAERPDGTRVSFTPYPTPLFDGDGRFTGALNMLIDVTATRPQDQASRCRRLARETNDQRTADALDQLALDIERAIAPGAGAVH